MYIINTVALYRERDMYDDKMLINNVSIGGEEIKKIKKLFK